MHVSSLRLRDFRNYSRLDVDFQPGFHLLLGGNAQGKTNLLEAIYLLASLRSFRGVSSSQLVRSQQKGYFVGATVVAESPRQIKIYWSPRERKLTLDHDPVRNLADYYGVVRVVVFCSEDLHLVTGGGRPRRRFLDLLLAQTHSHYLGLLQRYARALRSRNALLKQARPDPSALKGFTKELVEAGRQIISLRQALVPRVSPLIRLAYRRISRDAEEFRMAYQPSVKQDFAVELANAAQREQTYKTTVIGPHRDDLRFLIDERPVAAYASEGQKRSLAIALKIAQAEYLAGLHGSPPILLIDDVMGELDAQRRAAFLPLLSRVRATRGQVFMTCTEENWPRELAGDWHRWQIRSGTLQPVSQSTAS